MESKGEKVIKESMREKEKIQEEFAERILKTIDEYSDRMTMSEMVGSIEIVKYVVFGMKAGKP